MAKGHGGHSGRGGGSKSSTPMTKEAASRIQSAGDRNPGGKASQSGFAERAQSAADKAGSNARSLSASVGTRWSHAWLEAISGQVITRVEGDLMRWLSLPCSQIPLASSSNTSMPLRHPLPPSSQRPQRRLLVPFALTIRHGFTPQTPPTDAWRRWAMRLAPLAW
jgi:hypothetical protein